MTYSSGGLIQATDYNGFVSTTSGANVNDVWATGSSNKGWGQTALSTASVAGTVTATQWASLVNTITSMGNQTSTTITTRTAPTAGSTISILSNLNTDLTNVTTNRLNASGSGSQYTAWTGSSSKTTTTGSGTTAWTITFTHTVTWASADAARYFFNGGGRIKWQVGKTSTGTTADPEWNDLAGTLTGAIFITAGGSQTIAGTGYTGTTKSGGTGTPNTLSTATGWYNLTTSDTLLYRQYADTSPYTGQFIALNAKTAGSGTQLVITTTWTDPGYPNPYSIDQISGGTATSGITFGTAPSTVVTYFPPSSTYLTSASWGTPTVVGSVA
jgi:hypothetical protein